MKNEHPQQVGFKRRAYGGYLQTLVVHVANQFSFKLFGAVVLRSACQDFREGGERVRAQRCLCVALRREREEASRVSDGVRSSPCVTLQLFDGQDSEQRSIRRGCWRMR